MRPTQTVKSKRSLHKFLEEFDQKMKESIEFTDILHRERSRKQELIKNDTFESNRSHRRSMGHLENGSLEKVKKDKQKSKKFLDSLLLKSIDNSRFFKENFIGRGMASNLPVNHRHTKTSSYAKLPSLHRESSHKSIRLDQGASGLTSALHEFKIQPMTTQRRYIEVRQGQLNNAYLPPHIHQANTQRNHLNALRVNRRF